jgi:hypothetical protein
MAFVNNSIYLSGTGTIGVKIYTVPVLGHALILNNIIMAVTGISATSSTNGVTAFRNHFVGCTNNLTNITELAAYNDPLGILYRLLDDDTDPWVTKATSDFTLAPTNNIDRTAGFPGIFEGQVAMVGYPDIGAVSRFNQPHFGDRSGGKQ